MQTKTIKASSLETLNQKIAEEFNQGWLEVMADKVCDNGWWSTILFKNELSEIISARTNQKTYNYIKQLVFKTLK